MTPASIRYNNPGAQWDGKTAKKWGSDQHAVLADREGNHIAIFSSKIAGASAQFDLWRTNYSNMTLDKAIKKWCGGNSTVNYMSFLVKQTGLSPSTIITPELLSGPTGIDLMKAQAHWEAGMDYPMTDDEWAQAQKAVFKKPTPVIATAIATAVGGGTVVEASDYGSFMHFVSAHWIVILLSAVALGIAVDLITTYTRKPNV